jgi:U-box domain
MAATQVNTTIPTEFVCALTHNLMTTPLMSKTGHNFDREAILAWVDAHGTCPVTGKPLVRNDLVSNHALRIKIEFWCKNNGLDAAEVTDSPCHEKTTIDVSKFAGGCATNFSLQEAASMTTMATAGSGVEAAHKWNQARLSAQISKVLKDLEL